MADEAKPPNRKARREIRRKAFLDKLKAEGRLRRTADELRGQHTEEARAKQAQKDIRVGRQFVRTDSIPGAPPGGIIPGRVELVHAGNGSHENEIIAVRKNHGGLPKRTMTQEQKIALIEHLSVGQPIMVTLRDMGMTTVVLRNTFEADPEFHAKVRTYEHALDGDCEVILYAKAREDGPGSIAAATTFLSHTHRRRYTSASLRLKARETAAKERMAQAVRDISDKGGPQPDFTAISRDEYVTLRDIQARQEAGQPVTKDEKVLMVDLLTIVNRAGMERAVARRAALLVDDEDEDDD